MWAPTASCRQAKRTLASLRSFDGENNPLQKLSGIDYQEEPRTAGVIVELYAFVRVLRVSQHKQGRKG